MTDSTPLNPDERAYKAALAIDVLSEILGADPHSDRKIDKPTQISPRDIEKLYDYLKTDPKMVDRVLSTADKNPSGFGNVTLDLERATVCIHAIADFFNRNPHFFGRDDVQVKTQAHLMAGLNEGVKQADDLLKIWNDRVSAMTGVQQDDPIEGGFAQRHSIDEMTGALRMTHITKVQRQAAELIDKLHQTKQIFDNDEALVLKHHHEAPVLELFLLATAYLEVAHRELNQHRRGQGGKSSAGREV